MKHRYYKLDLIRSAMAKHQFGNCASMAVKMVEHSVLGRHGILFEMTAEDCKIQSVLFNRPGYEVQEVHDPATLDMHVINAFAKNQWDVKQLIADGFRMWAGLQDSLVVNGAWTISGDRMSNYFFDLQSTDIVISRCLTLEMFRGRGYYPAILVKTVTALAAEGYQRFFISALDWNDPSLKGIARAGFKELGRYLTTKKGQIIKYHPSNPEQPVHN